MAQRVENKVEEDLLKVFEPCLIITNVDEADVERH